MSYNPRIEDLERKVKTLPTGGSVPVPSAEDEGKTIVVNSEGEYALETASSGLPSYTDADEGKVLGLSEDNGTVAPAWVNGGGGILRVGITYDGETYDIDKTWAEVTDAIENDKLIILEDLVDYQCCPAIPTIDETGLFATLVGVITGDGFTFLVCIWVEIFPPETPDTNASVYYNSGTISITPSN